MEHVFKFPRILVLMISMALAINIFQFIDIDSRNNTNYKALNFNKPSNIKRLGLTSPTVRGYYMAWFALARVAPDSVIHIANDTEMSTVSLASRMYGIGKVSDVRESNISGTDVLKDIDPTQYVIASGENARNGRHYFLIASPYANDIELVKTSRGMLESNVHPLSPGSSFLLINWQGPEQPILPEIERADSYSYILLVDTSLLPDDLRMVCKC